jgi:predicted TIM-barrel fold metal-dependent hydrolase
MGDVAMDRARYTIISADGHAGADLLDYREYLPSRLYDEFDAWAADYEIPYDEMVGPDGDRNWNSERRLAELEADGVVAEVLFPNTVPPFFPQPSLTVQPPGIGPHDAELRWAGLQAHNRWLVDFCAAAPGRRAGIAQVSLHDVDLAVAEVRWAVEAGLTGGVLLPGVPPGVGLPQLFDPVYEPMWQVCAELGVPVNHHGGSASPPAEDTPEGKVNYLLEVTWFSHRALYQLMIGGVLERHPTLQLVFTEQGTAWIPGELMRLDYFFDRMRNAVGSQEHVWGAGVMAPLTLTPSEYFARQCHVGASFMRQAEVPLRHQVGLDRIMWGADYPHKEASSPFSELALRQAFAGVPVDEVERLVTLNAAELYGFDVEALHPIGDRVGPLVERVATPLAPGEVPSAATKCPALAGLN